MRFWKILPLALCLAAFLCGDRLNGQETFTATPASTSIVEARRVAKDNLQIRVKVQYLMVDTATRQAIYEGLNRESIVSSVQTLPAVEPVSLDESASPVASLQQIHAPSRVTTYALSESEFDEALLKAGESPSSQVNAAPKIILLDGNEVEMTDLVQRPFVIGFTLEGDTVKPTVHVLDDGTRLRLVGHLTEPDGGTNQPIELKAELTVMRVLDVKTDEVYGIKDEPLAVQVPLQQITSSVASRQLLAGQSLLIDPHLSQNHAVENETGIPMLGKIPYVGRSFKNVSKGVVQQHMILLLQPSVEPMVR